MKRIPEEELMDLPLRVRAYAGADFSEPNSKFVASFTKRFPEFDGERVADLGCGPGDITIRFAARYPAARIVGFDGADAMLDMARHAILLHALTDRIDVQKWHIGQEPSPVGTHKFDAVVSNSLLHHMRDPLEFWKAVRASAAPGAAVQIMDLIRPQSRIEAKKVIEKYASEEPEILRIDFMNSLLAAYRPAEIVEQLASVNMNSLNIDIVSDRHFIVFGTVDIY